MIVILWVVTAAIGAAVAAVQSVDLTRRWWRIRSADDNGIKPVLLTMSRLTAIRETMRFVASLGLLVLGLGALGRDAPVTFAVLVLFFANWVFALNSVLERVQVRAEDRYIDIETGELRPLGEYGAGHTTEDGDA